MTGKKDVAVLMGGWSAEREVSLVSGAAVSNALKKLGHHVTTIDVGREIGTLLKSLHPRVQVAFNALHGRFGEDGCIQGALEIIGLPYTHSGVLASALAMDKPTARRLFQAAGLRVAEGMVLTREQVLAGGFMAAPYVIKPFNEGSSVGVHIVQPGDNAKPFADTAWPYSDQVLVERFIPGRELTVAVMGDKALGCLEIRPKQGFYSYEAKYTDGKADHLMPAPLSPAKYQEALEIGLLAHRTLGCRGVSRTDIRYDDTPGGDGQFYVLEVNTQPGMTPLSLVPEIAAHAGINFEELVSWIVEDASCPR